MYSAKPVIGRHGTLAFFQDPDHHLPSWVLFLAVPYPGHSLAYSKGTLNRCVTIKHSLGVQGLIFLLCGAFVPRSWIPGPCGSQVA